MGSFSWRYVYLLAIGLRFVFGTSNSYLHPDEHFQSFEVLADILGYSHTKPWEFDSDHPARSYGPLYVVYGPLLYLIKQSGVPLKPMAVWYLVRIQLIVVNWLITDMCLYRLLPTKQERVKAVFFTATSYITLVHQSHSFSNSIETPLVLLCVLIIDDFRRELEDKSITPGYVKPIAFGMLVGFGLFNRVTFPAFLLLPSYFVVKYGWCHKLGLFLMAFGFLSISGLFILLDTYKFGQLGTTVAELRDWNRYILTPLNNLVYNSNYSNLALHGIHSRFTHLISGIPQILGPGIFFLYSRFRNSYCKTTPFLAFISGLGVLSLVPHQEVRFLIPLVPLACCCFDFGRLAPDVTKPSKSARYLIGSWYIFNLTLAVLMGLYHQGGVIPVIDHSYASVLADKPFVHVWWRTYTPPTWMYGDTTNGTAMMDVKNYVTTPIARRTIIDAMGSDLDIVDSILTDFQDHDVYLIAPTASMNCDFHSNHTVSLEWEYHYHLDLDHLNFESARCLQPGIGIYKVS